MYTLIEDSSLTGEVIKKNITCCLSVKKEFEVIVSTRVV